MVDKGYALVYVDARGTGGSRGKRSESWSQKEREDGYDSVEWLGEQPWCNGSVGMTGKSYLSKGLLLVASMNPPHLHAGVALSGAGDTYDLFYPGGNMRYMMMVYVAAFMLSLDFAPAAFEDPEGRYLDVWREHLDGNSPPFLKEIEEPVLNSRHKSNDNYLLAPKIRTPIYFTSGWLDSVPTEVLRMYNSLPSDVPKKVIIGPWGHFRPDLGEPGPKIDFLPEFEKWFARWLKDEKNGIESQPPITIFSRHFQAPSESLQQVAGEWLSEEDWPPRNFEGSRFYLGEKNRLSKSAPPAEDVSNSDSLKLDAIVGTSSGIWPGMGWICLPGDQKEEEAHSLVYTTEPFDHNTEIAGAPQLELFFSSDSPVVTFVAKLNLVSPLNESLQITKGILNATRASSFENPIALQKDKTYKIKIALRDLAFLVPRGFRLRLMLSCSDFPEVWPTPNKGTTNIYHNSTHASSLFLPIASAARNRRVAEFELPSLVENPTSRSGGVDNWLVSRDKLKKITSVKMGTTDEYSISEFNRGFSKSGLAANVSESSPGIGSAEAFYDWTISTRHITTLKSRVHFISDEDSFHTSASISIELDGTRYFEKMWTKSVKRVLL